MTSALAFAFALVVTSFAFALVVASVPALVITCTAETSHTKQRMSTNKNVCQSFRGRRREQQSFNGNGNAATVPLLP